MPYTFDYLGRDALVYPFARKLACTVNLIVCVLYLSNVHICIQHCLCGYSYFRKH